MKNKKCNKIIERYLQLDKNQRLPLAITLHILSCKSCKNKMECVKNAKNPPIEVGFSDGRVKARPYNTNKQTAP